MSGPIQRFYQVLAPANHYFILSHEDSEAGPLAALAALSQPVPNVCTQPLAAHRPFCLSCLSVPRLTSLFAPEQVPVDWLCAARGCSNMLMVFEAQGAEGFGGVAIVQVLPSTY